ncbi:MAG: FKBP-type peptidyl-prolyl cis-trans isomerase [Lachnospiraceae bacterium]|nr:FKBP-type peptidyl-prolyl cis-trans isomerase [Lachnospiraceae bacterium]
MKKIWKQCLIFLCLAMLATGCSGKKQPAETGKNTEASKSGGTESDKKAILREDGQKKVDFSQDYDPADCISLDADYRGIRFSEKKLRVTEEAVQSEVNDLLLEHQKLEEVTDRGALDGDTLDVDFTGTMDGKTIYDEKHYQLVLGSGFAVPGFEEQLEGAKAGDEIRLDLQYPKDYMDAGLRGKTVHFTVTVYKVSLASLPDYTDQFVAEHTEYDTIASYEAAVKKKLEQTKREDAVAGWMQEHTVLKSCPDNLREEYEQKMLSVYEMAAEYRGDTDLEGILKEYGYASKEEFLKDNKELIEADIRGNLACEYVIQKEKLSSTVSEYVEYMEDFAKTTGYKDAEELLDSFTEKEMRQYYMKKIAADWILEHADIR